MSIESQNDVLIRLQDENKALRVLLAVSFCGVGLYGDDGELQDNTEFPFIDFRRDSAKNIRKKMFERAKVLSKQESKL